MTLCVYILPNQLNQSTNLKKQAGPILVTIASSILGLCMSIGIQRTNATSTMGTEKLHHTEK